MRIGIYGDSYADNMEWSPVTCWATLLSQKYQVTNYGVQGSSLYYSVVNLLKNFKKYDKNILIVTQPGRLMIPDSFPVSHVRNRCIAGMGMIDSLKYNLKEDSHLAEFYNTAKQYFLLLQDFDYETYIHNLMVEDILKKVPGVILIPAFSNSMSSFNGSSMYDITLKETVAWGETESSLKKYNDVRNCHMTAENNAIFADKVEQWINGADAYINVDDFCSPTNKEFYLR